MVKRTWVKRYSELPPESQRLLVLQSWDTASKGGPDNDWSVCTSASPDIRIRSITRNPT